MIVDSIPEWVKTWSQFGHPLLMWILLGTSLYALNLGLQIRKIRNADKEIRKELIKKNVKERHHQVGSILQALIILGTMGGMAVTYLKNGKLFVGPHLLAGFSMIVIVAISVSLVPYMQKGNDWARNAHVALNIAMLGVFGWQAVSGMQIVQDIISKM